FPINYYLWAHGTQLIQADGETWTVAVDESDLVEAMEYFDAYFTQGITPTALQAITDYGDPSIVGALDDGSFAMTFMPPAAFRAAREKVGAELRTAPMPGGLEDGSTHPGGRALAVHANRTGPEAAWDVPSLLPRAQTFARYTLHPASARTLGPRA